MVFDRGSETRVQAAVKLDERREFAAAIVTSTYTCVFKSILLKHESIFDSTESIFRRDKKISTLLERMRAFALVFLINYIFHRDNAENI